MATPYYPKHHHKDVWNLPDKFFRNNSRIIGGGKAAQMLGMSRVHFYQHIDELGLTVYRRARQHNGRYFRLKELKNLEVYWEWLRKNMTRELLLELAEQNSGLSSSDFLSSPRKRFIRACKRITSLARFPLF